jgi:hypothetical protein
VDLVMDRFASTPGPDGVIAAVAQAPAQPNVRAVEKILKVLAEMPAVEPPADLLSRTMQRIEQSSTQPGEVAPDPALPWAGTVAGLRPTIEF